MKILGIEVQTLTEGGMEYVPTNWICEKLGLDPTVQVRRLRANGIEVRKVRVPKPCGTKGWLQTCIAIEDVPRWEVLLQGQSRESFVYFVEAPSVGLVKIGVAHDVNSRFQSLCNLSPIHLRLIKAVPGDSQHEETVRDRFREHAHHGDWFSFEPLRKDIEELESIEPQQRVQSVAENPTRKALLQLISDRPRSISELAKTLHLECPTVSEHVHKLLTANLVSVTPKGRKKMVSPA